MKIKYNTVTEGFDWGPAITKLVVQMDDRHRLNIKDMKTNNFDIRSFRHVGDHQVDSGQVDMTFGHECEVTCVYVSDEKGDEDKAGHFFTICLKVGPDRIENSPLIYSDRDNVNRFVDVHYQISLKSDHFIEDMTGAPCVLMNTEQQDKLRNYNLICDDFEHNQKYAYEGRKLTYASFAPKNRTDEKLPLIVWLHGAGEGGQDTKIAVLGNRVTNLAAPLVQSKFGVGGAYVLVPQTPTIWMDLDGESNYNIHVPNSDGKSYYTEALMHLIDDYVMDNENIDTSRIYLGGCSNGGYMTIQMLVNHPNYFAAAFPIAEAYHVDWLTDQRLDVLEKVPMWITHAKNDPVVVIDKKYIDSAFVVLDGYIGNQNESDTSLLDHFSNALFARLKARGAKDIHYSLFDRVIDTSDTYKDELGNAYEYHGHFSWIYALNDECVQIIEGKRVSLFEWLSAKRL
ncbi:MULTISPECIES: prolyl oligopeptidase family serine peptidase [unclassified Fusibacter]|uniref:prolyl oligopeptidase family serine peptidase n=1 Tax=unclassified Fusibacter TaxID=2624464 RepID=UPI0013E92CB7|nr:MULTISPECIES: prolyl oligopeptidase family serine peptidase [unclassified Fusibacter]MCK8060216.1 prolyl oligopeptidase family serine peptidase [Fusibacter sp. A2]NPE22357.1 prolyl oligopeptidase family serine peptidase [Fusibacter sp. A1]